MIVLYTSQEMKSFRRCSNNREMVAQLVLVPPLTEGSLHCPFLLYRSWYRCVAVTSVCYRYLGAGAVTSLLVLHFLLLKDFERTEWSFKYRPSQIHIYICECERQLSEMIYSFNSGLHSWETEKNARSGRQRRENPEIAVISISSGLRWLFHRLHF